MKINEFYALVNLHSYFKFLFQARIKELEDALEAERELRLRVSLAKWFIAETPAYLNHYKFMFRYVMLSQISH